MPTPRFLQIHSLHSYPGALLNRDEAGMAKKITYGGHPRTRVSSQCLKRHWRTTQDKFSLHNVADITGAVRSRNTVPRLVIDPLRESGQHDEAVLDAVETAFNVGVYGASGGAQANRQTLLLGFPEVEYLKEKAQGICERHPEDAKAAAAAAARLFSDKEGEGENFHVFRHKARLPSGIEGALFGRFVTSDPAANIDASVHVAHSFTVHRQESENDYFAAVDDLRREGDHHGSDHIGESELTAGLFYGYVVIDVPGLVSNIEGCRSEDWLNADRQTAAEVVRHFVHLVATVSPAAKLGSTAPYARAQFLLVEAGDDQPASLAHAYRHPSPAQTEAAIAALSQEVRLMDQAYGVGVARRYMNVRSEEGVPEGVRMTLPELADWAAGAVAAGAA